jgi:hypothetical protein
MTVIVSDLKTMTPQGIEKSTFSAGETIRIWMRVVNTGFLPAAPKTVYVYWGQGNTARLIGSFRTGWIGGAGPGGEEIHTYDYKIPEATPTGVYFVGARTEEQDEMIIRTIQVVEPVSPTMGRLDIKTQPSGAKIYVDGQYAGVAPVMVDVKPGTHDIRVELEDYKVKDAQGADVISDDTVRASVNAGEVKTVVITLEPSKPIWKSAWFWGLMGIGAGAVIAMKKRPEYVRRAREYIGRGIERVRPVVERGVERIRERVRL